VPKKVSEQELIARNTFLESALRESETRAARAKEAWSSLYDSVQGLKEDRHRLESEYEQLRLQKGGFGFKSLLSVGLASAVFTVFAVWVYLKVRPQPPHAAAFYKFRHETLVNYELQLSQGDFDPVLRSLPEHAARLEFQAIKPEISYLEKIVGAAKRSCK
jgi:hypothetical protein